MKNERILTPTTFALVAFLHAGLMALLWQSNRPVQQGMAHIEFVDLGDFGGGDGRPEGSGAPAPAAEPQPKAEPEPPKPKAEPKPQPKPKPAEQPKPELKPVVTQKAQADIRQQKETPKPKPVEQPKPEPVAKPQPEEKPVEKPAEPVAEKAAAPANYSKKITAKDGTGDGSGYAKIQGKGSGSGGDGEGRGMGRGEGSGSKTGAGHGSGEGGGSGAGSSRGNPVKASGSIPRPPYPSLSLENSEEGTVRLRVLVSPTNSVVDVKVAKSSGFSRLDRAAANAARSGNFNSQGKWTEYMIPVSFSLNER